MSSQKSMALQAADATAKKSRNGFKRELPMLQTEGVNIWDNQVVYLTDVYQQWERHLLLKIIKKIHKLVISSLTKEEEQLFSLYQKYDTNLDGIVAGEEAVSLERDVRVKARMRGQDIDESGKDALIDEEGYITFSRLLSWHSECNMTSASGYFNVFSDMMDTTLADTERRIEALDLESLRRNLVGYRQQLEDVMGAVHERNLQNAYATQRTKGLLAAGEEYHKALINELTEDEKVLFDAFLQVDSSGDLLLQREEVECFMKRIEPDADQNQINTYVADLDMDEEESLTFVDLLQWWDDAEKDSDSAVAQKRLALIKSVKNLAFDSKVDAFLSSDWSGKRIWRSASDEGDEALGELRDAYIRVMREVRHYNMELSLRKIERDSISP